MVFEGSRSDNKRKEISLGKASQLLGISYPELVDILGAMGVEIRIGPKSIEEAEKDLIKV